MNDVLIVLLTFDSSRIRKISSGLPKIIFYSTLIPSLWLSRSSGDHIVARNLLGKELSFFYKAPQFIELALIETKIVD